MEKPTEPTIIQDILVLTHRDDLPARSVQDSDCPSRTLRYIPVKEIDGVYLGRGKLQTENGEVAILSGRDEFSFGEPIWTGMRDCVGHHIQISIDDTGKKYTFSFNDGPPLKKSFPYAVAPQKLYTESPKWSCRSTVLKGVLKDVIDQKTVEMFGEDGPFLIRGTANSGQKVADLRKMVGKVVLVEDDENGRFHLVDFECEPKREEYTVVLTQHKDIPDQTQETEDPDKRIRGKKVITAQQITGSLWSFDRRGFYIDHEQYGRTLVDTCRNMVKDIDQREFLGPLQLCRGKPVTISVDDTGKTLSVAVDGGPSVEKTFDAEPAIPSADTDATPSKHQKSGIRVTIRNR